MNSYMAPQYKTLLIDYIIRNLPQVFPAFEVIHSLFNEELNWTFSNSKLAKKFLNTFS